MSKNEATATAKERIGGISGAGGQSAGTSNIPPAKGNGTYQPSQVREPFTVVMYLDRVTKNAVRYQEEHSTETEPDRVGQLYLQKHNFPKGAPQRIVVTIGRIE